jgi:hypothetical protein
VRPPGPRPQGLVLHLAAGVVVAVVAVELLPDLMRAHEPLDTVVGFAAGTSAMLASSPVVPADRGAYPRTLALAVAG